MEQFTVERLITDLSGPHGAIRGTRRLHAPSFSPHLRLDLAAALSLPGRFRTPPRAPRIPDVFWINRPEEELLVSAII